MSKRLLVTAASVAALGLSGLVTPVPAQAGFGDFMNPGKWFGGKNRDRDYYYDRYDRGYGYPGGYGYGYPGGYGYGGHPGYGGYGYPGWGYGAPGYGYPGQGGSSNQTPAPPPTPQ